MDCRLDLLLIRGRISCGGQPWFQEKHLPGDSRRQGGAQRRFGILIGGYASSVAVRSAWKLKYGLDGQLVANSHNIVKTAYPDVIVPEGLSSPNGDDFPMPTCVSL